MPPQPTTRCLQGKQVAGQPDVALKLRRRDVRHFHLCNGVAARILLSQCQRPEMRARRNGSKQRRSKRPMSTSAH